MKICILGAGALGSAIGGTLAGHGCDVTLVNRSAAYVEAVSARGLLMVEEGVERAVRLQARQSAEGLGPVDLVIVLVKSFDTKAAIASAASAIGPQTIVLSLQNGLGHEEILAEAVGREKVIAGKTYVGGLLLEPGKTLIGVKGKETIIGELSGGTSSRIEALAARLTLAGLETQVTPNIYGAMWDKLFINVAGGALTAITRLTYGGLYSLPILEETALAAIGEAMAVARASGVAFETKEPREAFLKAGAGLPPQFKTSMLQSLERGALTEVDFIHGAVVRRGAKCGVPTPVNSTLVACVKGIEYARAAYPGKP